VAKQFGEKLKQIRENQNLLQRQLASLLDIDTPLFSKIERGERVAKKEIVEKLADILKSDREELLTLWLADQVMDVVKNEDVAFEALKSVSQTINSKK
jgi:transcriptional regulator with XRE-family HTH domain